MTRLALLIATAGYVGLAPVAPGTWGSAVGVCLLLLVRLTGWAGAEALLLGAVLVVGVWAATVAERRYGRPDRGAIVIDEIAGMLIALLWVPVAWPWLVVVSWPSGFRHRQAVSRPPGRAPPAGGE